MIPPRLLAPALGILSAAVGLLGLDATTGGRDAGTAVTLPNRLAGYSYLTGDVSDAPPGRVVALYQHGFGVEFSDFPQALVLAADDDVYRRLDLAEAHAGRETQGDPGPMLLSPDGSRVALGDHTASDPRLDLVDLGTGAVVRRALPDARSVIPVAWSDDGRRVAYLAGDRPTDPHGARSHGDAVFVLDLSSGNVEAVPGGRGALTAAFSPDGQHLAVERRGRQGRVVVIDLTSSRSRSISRGGALAGPRAWSPDGRLLAVVRASTTDFLDVTHARPSTSFRLPATRPLLGWVGAREVVLVDTSADDTTRLVARSLEHEGSRELTRIEGTSHYGVSRFQLASALLPDLETRVAGEPARGPLPPLVRLLAAVLLGLAVSALATAFVRRRPPRP